MEIILTWEDPGNQELQKHSFTIPLGIGREAVGIPDTYEEQSLSKVVFKSREISVFHALICVVNGELTIKDISTNGTRVNGNLLQKSSRPLKSGDTLQIGPFQVSVSLNKEIEGTEILNQSPTILNPQTEVVNFGQQVNQSPPATIVFNPETDKPDTITVTSESPELTSFPSREFMASEFVDVQSLYATGKPVQEQEYVALGGGIGSFAWVDHIRIYGVKPDKITVLGLEKKPYGRYQRLCENSQIPPHERLRSGSDSCPDNLWGWPGYAWREAWRELFSGEVSSALKHLWQVFAEPVVADTYTPMSGKVFESIDREAERIGWSSMLKYGRIRAIRKTTDGRYAIAYSVPNASERSHGYLVGRYVHIATGYPAIRFLPDLQKYRQDTQDFKSVVNAYEEHNHIYKHLESRGGTLIIRGRGIVSSRIIQRISEARRKNPKITVIHVMRTPVKEGQKFGSAQRKVENHWEFQPYNWPKATWGGDMRSMLEAASPAKRYELLKDWGGTTTADRTDWKKIIQEGLDSGWYSIEFGQVEKVERNNEGKPLSYIRTQKGLLEVAADFIVDSTGLEAKPQNNPLFADLISRYNLSLSPYGGLQAAKDFEMKEMRNIRGRMYVSGVLTLGGPYAAIDTFLGLQYAAQRAADALVATKAPGIGYVNGLGSLWQWIKWATNQQP
ncbi:FHA domain-containing protein [Plectonema cf. radiosum LEGE 06105]|uniref:FHA domain-containing protein n=1 Tax=Plectonema cf. radiosum LEGE 06105 TaxID=945769 RepID=A0A8J7F1H4_9CYAN|nr:FHA domain-containing protein [Plectonema radiosum]MBE9214288.1 FHA domain-containing protein [Plectonema cf. radiosum LEGE 06105]